MYVYLYVYVYIYTNFQSTAKRPPGISGVMIVGFISNDLPNFAFLVETHFLCNGAGLALNKGLMKEEKRRKKCS